MVKTKVFYSSILLVYTLVKTAGNTMYVKYIGEQNWNLNLIPKFWGIESRIEFDLLNIDN